MKLRIHESLAQQPELSPIAFSTLSHQALFQQRFERHGNVIHRSENEDRLLSEIHVVSNLLKRSSEPLFYIESLPNGRARVRASDLGTRLIKIASGKWEKLQEDYPVHNLSPYIRCFKRLGKFYVFKFDRLESYFNCSTFLKVAKLIAKAANRAVFGLRKFLRLPSMKKAQESFGRSANENFKNFVQTYEWIRQEHTEVVNLRFDTHMREQGALPYKFGDQLRLNHLNYLRGCRTRFHRWLKDRFGSDLLIYAWTLEYGRESAFHHHYVVTLKPRGNEEHIALVEEIGRKWEAITKGSGWIHNCNTHWRTYLYGALGLVRLDDREVIKGLHFIAAYLTLAAVFVKLKLPKRAFGMGGNYPEEEPIPKAGRPLKAFFVPIAITSAEGRAGYVNFL